MKVSHMFGAACVCVVSGTMLAQVVPICCRYLYDWPAGSQGPSGACSGQFATVCEDSSSSATSTDPMAMLKIGHETRWAQCCLVDVGLSGYFVRRVADHHLSRMPSSWDSWTMAPAVGQ